MVELPAHGAAFLENLVGSGQRLKDATLEQVLVQEYRVSCASLRSHDFVEGIRAQLVDKDRNPTWSPAALSAVTAADVENYFTPADPDLTF